jgi:hypothetical protein
VVGVHSRRGRRSDRWRRRRGGWDRILGAARCDSTSGTVENDAVSRLSGEESTSRWQIAISLGAR